jgi:hypothetical protein
MIYKVIGRETIASLAASVGFTSTYIPPTDKRTTYAVIQVVGGDCRFTIEGTTPTADKGIRLPEDSSAEIWGSDALTAFRCIDDTGTAKLEVIYMGGSY